MGIFSSEGMGRQSRNLQDSGRTLPRFTERVNSPWGRRLGPAKCSGEPQTCCLQVVQRELSRARDPMHHCLSWGRLSAAFQFSLSCDFSPIFLLVTKETYSSPSQVNRCFSRKSLSHNVGVVLMLRSCSPISSGSVSKEALGGKQ